MKNKAASIAAAILGGMNKGKKKNLTEEQKEACRKRMEIARKKRWAGS